MRRGRDVWTMTADETLPAFIRSTFPSVWTLEIMCHLRRLAPAGSTPAQIVADLRASELVVTGALSVLTTVELVTVEPNGTALYAPANATLDGLADQAVALYARSPNSVRRMIAVPDRDSLAAFADAFKLRRD